MDTFQSQLFQFRPKVFNPHLIISQSTQPWNEAMHMESLKKQDLEPEENVNKFEIVSHQAITDVSIRKEIPDGA
jgi:hypothetical protein